MGMTIDEAIEILQERDNFMEYVTDNDSEAFEMAVDTMRKYQKIEQIVERWACCGNPSDSMIAISEVLEDGKIG